MGEQNAERVLLKPILKKLTIKSVTNRNMESNDEKLTFNKTVTKLSSKSNFNWITSRNNTNI